MSSDKLLEAILQKLNRGGAPDRRFPDRKGEFWALCPFHPGDSHPTNFSVSAKGFKCFACGEKGGLHKLAERVGVDALQFDSGIRHPSPSLPRWRTTPKPRACPSTSWNRSVFKLSTSRVSPASRCPTTMRKTRKQPAGSVSHSQRLRRGLTTASDGEAGRNPCLTDSGNWIAGMTM